MAHEGCSRWHAMNRAKSRVAVLSATYRTAEEQIRRALQLLEYRPQRNKILLKPNLVTIPRWLPLGGIPRSAITDVRFIEALLRVLDGYEIIIADGALAATDTDEVLEKSGVAALALRSPSWTVSLDWMGLALRWGGRAVPIWSLLAGICAPWTLLAVI